MKNTYVIAILAVFLLAAGYFLYVRGVGKLSVPVDVYQNEAYGISFKYPDTYVLQEREVGNGERAHYAVVLIDRVALANIPEAGEGPPTITIDIFQNNLDKQSVEGWIQNTSESNFKISLDRTLTPTSVGGASAQKYTWDGLYRGDSVVFAHRENIVMASVMYPTPRDQIRADFFDILSSITLF